jgi:hypothetical protein
MISRNSGVRGKLAMIVVDRSNECVVSHGKLPKLGSCLSAVSQSLAYATGTAI